MSLIKSVSDITSLVDDVCDMAQTSPKDTPAMRFTGLMHVPGMPARMPFEVVLYSFGDRTNTVKFTTSFEVVVDRKEVKPITAFASRAFRYDPDSAMCICRDCGYTIEDDFPLADGRCPSCDNEGSANRE